ncbi:hypothetical protein SAMN04489742_1356 [Arthrobacter crystallopoietes]|uniref:Uncharacterized protein n=2 Tax=Crystallibacter crystallopoietes TaxID=37928 RepID=A0A1H1BDF7_9MICC|nr:hypothetical protein SAMN04489742_1356 [Arthrobacter crystallopoietes]
MDEALLACLERLRDGGPTQWEDVEVHDAWSTPDAFAITYSWPWGPDVGLVRRRASMQGEDPVEAAQFIADFDVAEPLGTAAARLHYDRAGLGWWGDLPAPGRSSR